MDFLTFYEGKKATLTVNSVDKESFICHANITLKVGGRYIHENVDFTTGCDLYGHLWLITADYEHRIDITKDKDLIDYLYIEQEQGRMSNIYSKVSFIR